MKKNIRKSMLLKFIAITILTAIVVCQIPAGAIPAHTDGRLAAISVRDHGAIADGKTDDSGAFNKAVAAAKKIGVPVFVPGGNYALAKTVEINGVELIGDASGPWPADVDNLPRIIMTEPKASAFSLQNGTITGITISTQVSQKNYVNFNECIEIVGNNATVKHVKFSNICVGIKVTKNDITGLVLDNLFMSTVHRIGLFITGTKNAVLKNIEVWTPTGNSDIFPGSGIAFHLINNDNLYIQGCFGFCANQGFVFETSGGKSQSAVMDNCSVDFSSIGVVVRGNSKLDLTGGTYFLHHTGLLIEGQSAVVSVTGASMRANGSATIKIHGGSKTTISGCTLRRTMVEWLAPAVEIQSSPNVTIDGCMIYCTLKTGNTIDWANPTNLVFTNNIINSGTQMYGQTPSGGIVKNNLLAPYRSPL